MQNRLVISAIPLSVPQLPHATEALRDIIEEHGCWVDRFAFLKPGDDNDDDDDNSSNKNKNNASKDGVSDLLQVRAIVELHVENIRDRAVKALNGLSIVLACDGSFKESFRGDHKKVAQNDDDSDGSDDNDDNNADIIFTMYASKANTSQSKYLIQKCPVFLDEVEDIDEDEVAAKERMMVQTLRLTEDMELTVHSARSSEMTKDVVGFGGTGTDPWRGGLILAQQMTLWLGSGIHLEEDNHKAPCAHVSAPARMPILVKSEIDAKTESNASNPPLDGLFVDALFHGKDVVELGAGSTGIPSMTLASMCKHQKEMNAPQSIIASDGVDEVVYALQRNVELNELGDSIRVHHMDWSDGAVIRRYEADTIIFADCVYNEEGATALCSAIQMILRPKGNVIGVLPDYRVGIDLFENIMETNGFVPNIIERMESENIISKTCDSSSCEKINPFFCSGGGGKNYRILWWRR